MLTLFVNGMKITPFNVFEKIADLQYMTTDPTHGYLVLKFVNYFFETYRSRSFNYFDFVCLFKDHCATFIKEHTVYQDDPYTDYWQVVNWDIPSCVWGHKTYKGETANV